MLGSAALQLFAKTTKCFKILQDSSFFRENSWSPLWKNFGRIYGRHWREVAFPKKGWSGRLPYCVYTYIYIYVCVCVIRISSRHSGGGKGQRREEMKREDQRRERVRRQKMQAREKVAKPRNTVFFQWFVAPAGRKVGSLKRRVRSRLGRWEMKNCTPLWREAHLQVKMYKTHQVRSTFGSWDVEKVHAAVARTTFRSQKC